MREIEILKDKFETLVSKPWPFPDENIENLLNKCPEFFRSIEVFNSPHGIFNCSSEIDKLILLLKEIIGIEMLLGCTHSRLKEQFSVRSSWLLGKGENQREKIQNHLGTLYSLRSDIVHGFNISKDNRRKNSNFSKFFESKIENAFKFANEYHRLILMRLITKESSIITKELIQAKDKSFKVRGRLDVPLSIYEDKIRAEVDNLTEIPSTRTEQQFQPESSEYYRLGINTHGGLTELAHYTIEYYERFYEDNERIIPESDVWDKVYQEINDQRRKIEQEKYKKVQIFPKTHLSILFYLGYRFHRLSNIFFKDDQVRFDPIKELKCDPEHYWDLRINTIKSDDREAIIILNIPRYIDPEVKNDLKSLKLQNFPLIVLDCKCSNGKGKPRSQCISSLEQISRLCKAIEDILTYKEETQLLQRVHLFVRGPDVMMVLLGMHFYLRNLKVFLYERGKRSSGQDYEHYYRVLHCK